MSDLADDLLFGAGAIAEELFGKNTRENRRRIYHLHQRKCLPTWKNGAEIVSRRSALRDYFKVPTKGEERTAAA